MPFVATLCFVAPVRGGPPPPELEAGDANQNLEFDQHDLVQVQVAGKYLTGNPASWGEGDWNGAPGGEPGSPPSGDGVFDQVDIIGALNAGQYRAGPYAAGGVPTPLPAALLGGGSLGDSVPSVVYDPATGELSLDLPSGVLLTSIQIHSLAGIFTGDPAQNLGGIFDVDNDGLIFKVTFGASFGEIDFGSVSQAGLGESFLLGDLRVNGSLSGGGAIGTIDLVCITCSGPQLQAGDADENLEVDQHDLVQVLVAGKYLTAEAASWGEGDWDGAPGGTPGSPPPGDGTFNMGDLVALVGNGLYRSGPYAQGGPPAPLPPRILFDGRVGDAVPSIVYDAVSGEVAVDLPDGVELTSLQIVSAAGIFTLEPVQNLGGSFDIDSDGIVFKATFGASFGPTSFGPIAFFGLSELFLLGDLRVNGSLAGGGPLVGVDLVDALLFLDGFELGDTALWSVTVGAEP